MEITIGEWRLRPWRLGDEEALVRYANNRRIWINLRDRFPHPYTMSDAISWVERARAREPATNLAIATASEAIGSVGLTVQPDVHRRPAEIGYWLAEPFWGRGIATRALRAFADYAFATFDLIRLYGTPFEWNPASARVLEKAGFSYEGLLRESVTKDGQSVGMWMYGLVRETGPDHADLAELVSGMNPENAHPETDWGAPRGDEVR